MRRLCLSNNTRPSINANNVQSRPKKCFDVLACDKLGTALADEDAAGGDKLTAKFFDAEALADAIASVAYAALTFLMCHNLFS